MNEAIVWSPGVTLKEINRQVILKAYTFYRQNKTATATALGISVRTLDTKLEEYGQDDETLRKADEQRKQEREYQLKRARGEIVAPNRPTLRASSGEATAGLRMESAASVPAQQSVSMPQRQEVQSVLPKQAAAGGGGKRR